MKNVLIHHSFFLLTRQRKLMKVDSTFDRKRGEKGKRDEAVQLLRSVHISILPSYGHDGFVGCGMITRKEDTPLSF
jgi:hypothetical protein